MNYALLKRLLAPYVRIFACQMMDLANWLDPDEAPDEEELSICAQRMRENLGEAINDSGAGVIPEFEAYECQRDPHKARCFLCPECGAPRIIVTQALEMAAWRARAMQIPEGEWGITTRCGYVAQNKVAVGVKVCPHVGVIRWNHVMELPEPTSEQQTFVDDYMRFRHEECDIQIDGEGVIRHVEWKKGSPSHGNA